MSSRRKELQVDHSLYGDLIRRLSLSTEQGNDHCPSPVASAILKSRPPILDNGSPGAVTQDAGSLDSSGSGSIPLSWGVRSPGKVSPLRGRTMKEYEEQLAALRKENFALKLRIYFLEERVDKKGEKEDKEQLYRTNIELKVETEALKQEVYDKQELVREASVALASLDQQYQSQLEAATLLHHQETAQLQATITALQKEVEEFAERARQAESDGLRMGELTQLCGLAFPSEDSGKDDMCPPVANRHLDISFWGQQEEKEERIDRGNAVKNIKGDNEDVGGLNAWSDQVAPRQSSLWMDDGLRGNNAPHPCTTPTTASTPSLHPQAVDPALSVYGGGLSSPSSIQGIFSLPEPTTVAQPSAAPGDSLSTFPARVPQEGMEVVGRLKERIRELEERVKELETQLEEKEEMKCVLEGDLENLKKEVEEKVERVAELEGEVAEREERLEEVMQELETRHSQLRDKDHQISSLHNDLNRVQPEMEVKVQEIVERDRIIEEKIEQIEQQNKILVEIQITLDERQKQLADAETRLAEAEAKLVKAEARADEATEKAEKLTQDLDKSCKVIQTFAEEVHARDKEIAGLRKEVKRKEKKIRDLVAELKEALDMLNKAKWEAETSGGEDGVKEMAEEENERLWAEVEARKKEVLSVRTAAEAAVAAAEERARALAEEVATLTALRDQQAKELATQQGQLTTLQSQLQQVRAETSGREGQLAAAQAQVKGLETQLADTRTQLDQKRKRLAELEDDLRATTAGELDRQALQVDRLQGHLAALAANSNNASDQHIGAAGETKEGQQACSDTSGTATARVDIVAMTQPVPVAMSGDSAGAVHHLYQEVSRLRIEADALREERSLLTQQLTSLYNSYSHTTPSLSSYNTTTTPQNATPNAHNTTLIPQSTTQAPCFAQSHNILTTPAPILMPSTNPTTTLAKCLAPPASCPTNTSHLTTPANQVNPAHTTISLDHTCSVTVSGNLTRTTPTPTSKGTLCPKPVCLEETVDVTNDEEGQNKEEERQEEAAVGQACQEQVEALKAELEEAQRVGEELGRVGESQSQRHKAEIAWLRRRLAESHTACDLLRTRLEELADFLEAILDLEGRGIITLDALPPAQLAALHNSLDQSRALSRSLSQSLMIGVDAGEEAGLSTSLNDLSSWTGHEHFHHPAQCQAGNTTIAPDANSLPGKDTVGLGENSFLGVTMAGYSQATTISLTQDSTAGLLQDLSMDVCQDTTVGQGQEKRAKMVQALAAQLTARLDQKTRELDAIAESVSDLTQRLASRTSQVTHQAGVIGELRATVGRLTAQLASQDSGHSSDPLPPPPLHLLRDSDCEAECAGLGSEPSSLGAIKSAYSTDVAIKVHSGRLAQQQLHHTGPGESGVGAGGDQWVASPSESEAWSEPDRNVSQARIGLDATTLAATPDRAPPRPRQPRTITLTSESEGEAQQDDPSIPAPTKITKRRSDVAELRRVSSRLRAVEQLNDTLRTELHLYHSLTHHLHPQHQTSATVNSTSNADATDTHTTPAATTSSTTATTTIAATSTKVEGEVALVAAPLLAEVRGLRSTLEEAITNNDHLRDQLEAALSAHPHEEARFLHLTAALQTAQEEVREARERSSVAQGQVEEARAKADQAGKEAEHAKKEAMQARTKLQEIMEEASEMRAKAEQTRLEVDETKQMAEEAKTEAEKAKKELENARTETGLEVNRLMGETKEAKLEAEETKFKLKQTLETAKTREEELEAEVRQMVARIISLEEEVQQLEAEVAKMEKQVKEEVAKSERQAEEEVAERERQAEEERRRLEEKEQRLLEVNKERLALVGERARLHARLTTQTEDRRRVEVEMEQLAEDKKCLKLEKEELEGDLKRLMEENRLMETDRKKLTEENWRMKNDKKRLVEAKRERGKSVELELEGLRGELEAERRVTETLQQRLEELRTLRSPDSSDRSVALPATSDASHESVTSLEYIPHPAPHHPGLWEQRQSLSPTTTPTPASPTPLPPPPHHEREKEREASVGNTSISSINEHERDTISNKREKENNITRRDRDSNRWEREKSSSNKWEKDTNNTRRERDSSTSKRNHSSNSSCWLENKENLLISTTNITSTTTTSTFSGKRSRKTIEGGSGNSGILALSSPNLIQEDEYGDFDVFRGPGEYGDGETTSGESPDLGIGSDHHYSSLERGTTISSTLAANYHTYGSSGHSILPHQPPSLPTQLCSEPSRLLRFPSHSALNMENERLRSERDNLAARLSSTLITLKEAHEKLSRSNQRKATMERAISKQLHKTHNVLQQANAHMKQAGSLPK